MRRSSARSRRRAARTRSSSSPSNHEIVCPRDPASGRPTGKRIHKPFVMHQGGRSVVTAALRPPAPNENIREARIDFWAATPTGLEKLHYTVRLTNANISGIVFKMPNIRNPKLARLAEYEEVAFTYQKIEWTWTDGGMSRRRRLGDAALLSWSWSLFDGGALRSVSCADGGLPPLPHRARGRSAVERALHLPRQRRRVGGHAAPRALAQHAPGELPDLPRTTG